MTLDNTNLILFYLTLAILLLAVAIFARLGTRHIPNVPPGHKRKNVLS